MPVEELADASDTIPYTLFCGVTGRVHRWYRN
jgi:alanine racemase